MSGHEIFWLSIVGMFVVAGMWYDWVKARYGGDRHDD